MCYIDMFTENNNSVTAATAVAATFGTDDNNRNKAAFILR